MKRQVIFIHTLYTDMVVWYHTSPVTTSKAVVTGQLMLRRRPTMASTAVVGRMGLVTLQKKLSDGSE